MATRLALLAVAAAASPRGALAEEQGAETLGGEVEALLAALPGKEEDVQTVTSRFRRDLFEYCQQRGCRQLAVVEVGCYRGYTTAILSHLFGRVFVLDNDASHLAAAREQNKDRTNVVYLRFELYSGLQRFDWSALLSFNDVHVAVIDAGHRYDQAAADIQSALSLPLVDTLVFDDYGLISMVRQAVDGYREAGMLECQPIGEELPELTRTESIESAGRFWSRGLLPENRSGLWEGQLCRVAAKGPAPAWRSALIGFEFVCQRLNGVMPDPYEVSFRVDPHSLRISSRRGGEADVREVGYAVQPGYGYALLLNEEVPPLPSLIVFGEKLRSGFSVREGTLEHLCLSSEDLQGLAAWSQQDVDRGQGWLR